MTQNTPTITGRVPDNTGKKPKVTNEDRTCSEKGCDTKLSRYNNKEACFRHRPPRFPRVRGRPR